MDKHNIITTEEQLIELLDLKSQLTFIFSFPELSDAENNSWTKRIKKNYFACGCNTGSVFMFLTLVLLIVIFSFKKFFLKEELYYAIYFYGLVLVLLMAIVGKVVGKKISYSKFKRDIYQLKATLKMNCHQHGIGKSRADGSN